MTEDRGYRLIDGEERNKQHPDTFEIPPAEARAGLAPGDFAKLGFEYSGDIGWPEGERMWVKIIAVADRAYQGVLDNKPLNERAPIAAGDAVEFEPRHVLSIL